MSDTVGDAEAPSKALTSPSEGPSKHKIRLDKDKDNSETPASLVTPTEAKSEEVCATALLSQHPQGEVLENATRSIPGTSSQSDKDTANEEFSTEPAPEWKKEWDRLVRARDQFFYDTYPEALAPLVLKLKRLSAGPLTGQLILNAMHGMDYELAEVETDYKAIKARIEARQMGL